jgi:SAM-dependent methyltransferase
MVRILELGCGEGRDAGFLLKKGYDLTATDISPEAIRYCRERWPEFSENFRVLDCVDGQLDEKFDFIYAVAVIHMLVEDDHRAAFYRFIWERLCDGGTALVCTMGDGTVERKSDITTAFDLQPRTHGGSGETLLLAGTSCRMVGWDSFLEEIRQSGLKLTEHGLTEVLPDFPVMMYAVMEK